MVPGSRINFDWQFQHRELKVSMNCCFNPIRKLLHRIKKFNYNWSIFKRELLHFSLHFTIARKYEITSWQIFPYPAFRFPIRTTSSAARNLQREDEKIHKFKFHFIDTSLHLNGARASTASTSFMRCQFATTKIDLCQHRLRKHLSTDRHNCFLIIRHEKLDDEVSRGAAVKWPVWLLIPS